jgi:hypothetical protein
VIALLILPLLLVSIPLAVVGMVQSARALKRIPTGMRGRGVALVGLSASILVLVFAVVLIPLLVIVVLRNAA